MITWVIFLLMNLMKNKLELVLLLKTSDVISQTGSAHKKHLVFLKLYLQSIKIQSIKIYKTIQ